MYRTLVTFLLLIISFSVLADIRGVVPDGAVQTGRMIKGTVLDDTGETLVGANVYWASDTHSITTHSTTIDSAPTHSTTTHDTATHSTTILGTTTDAAGQFSIPLDRSSRMLVVSYMGYHNDTTYINGTQPLTIVLVSDLVLGEVTITERQMAVLRSRLSAFDTQSLGTGELFKAACCNLSEAFETNPSVDVAYADAATGAKQIRLLGLSGTYVQLLTENTPAVRGLAQSFGLSYIPGTWMQSVQVSKGASSVINGYEATTGQINVEYLKPQTQKPLSINAMLNTELHPEVNIEGGWSIPLRHAKPGAELATGLMAHYEQGFLSMDENKDGFADMPHSQNANLANRWYYKQDGYIFQALVRGLYDHRRGGQMTSADEADPYRIDLRTYRVDGFVKNGIIFDPVHGTSLGIIASASYHNQQNTYGARLWDAAQTNAYLNTIFEKNWRQVRTQGDIEHKLSTGVSVNYDGYTETLLDTITSPRLMDFSRRELTAGLFAEYTLKVGERLSLVAGLRSDYSTRYAFFATPRLNIRYSPWEWWSLRASVGMGYRSPNLLADNASFLPSHRHMHFENGREQQEQALNTGVSSTFYIPIASRELQLTVEYYYTHFLNALVADYDRSTQGVSFYNLRDVGGKSYAHNAQIEATMEVLRGWTLTAAFRFTDARQTTFNAAGEQVLRLKPLTNRFKGLITTSYQTPLKKWQFDFTAQFNGGGRMPDGFNDLLLGQLGSTQYQERNGDLYYKWYPQLMAQITKNFRTCSIYLGAENMTNFRQGTPVLGAEMPFEQGFDASMAWAPTTGWKIYLGFRWALEREE